MNHSTGSSRRDFLKSSGMVVMAGAAGYFGFDQLVRAAEQAQAIGTASTSADYDRQKPTLVTIFLRGGCDTLNAFVPYADEKYYKYRPNLAIPYQCVAACIERAAEHWFTSGPLVDAVLASTAVPGVLPPVRIGDEHFLDGGLVNSIPVSRAVTLGARTIYVLQVGRIERPLEVPRRPWEVATVAFEIARRHRFAADMSTLPESVVVHVLPTGAAEPPRAADLSALRYRDFSNVQKRIDASYDASLAYLRDPSRQVG